MPRKAKAEPPPTRVEDYSEAMSAYERESLAAEAQLKAKRDNKTKPASKPSDKT
jgi:hypothetical protein